MRQWLRTILSQAQLSQFDEDGFLVAEDLLDQELDVAPVVAEYEALLDDLCAGWVDEGRLEGTFAALPFEQRIVNVYQAGLQYTQPLDIALPDGEIRADTPIHLGPAVFDLMRSPRLLDAMESFIGAEIYSNPIQDVRIKPPLSLVDAADHANSMLAKTFWHQDQGVTMPEADETNMITAWVAITDATAENGCLQVIPGSHRGEMVTHCPGKQTGIPDHLIDEDLARPVPVRGGGVIFFHPYTKHASLNNLSDSFRWSFDLRYNPIGEPAGRPFFPRFVARSQAYPESELRDVRAWAASWYAARRSLAIDGSVTLHRWDADAPVCA